MSKLKLNKITISNLNPEESSSIRGGISWTITTTVLISTVIASSACPETMSNNTNCLTDRPGTQDSCGLCNPRPDEMVRM